MKLSQLLIITTLAIWILSCTKSDTLKPEISPIFQPYYNKFLDEGKKRGITFTDKEQAITIQFSDIPKQYGAIGYTEHETNTIHIVSEWNNFPEPMKEWLVFHELGHLMLKRKHSFRQLPNGEYGSMMWTAENNPNKCIAPLFTGNLRKNYYFDELFKIDTPAPAWATDNTEWKEPIQNTQSLIVGTNSWNKNAALEGLVSSSPNQFSYKISPSGLSLMIGKTQTANSEFKLPLATLFPNLAEIPLQNYEIRMRYKLYGRGFELGWNPNNNSENTYALISNSCNGDNNYLGVSDNRGGFFVNNKILQDIRGSNELILRQKDNYIMIWLNGKLHFQSDITAGTGSTPLGINLYFGASQFDFEFITITRL